MDFLQGLNPRQREAAAYTEGPLLILAGAGSGKTRVITHRIANLIHAHGVPPWGIVAVTFTNKAAAEMRDRVAKLLQGAYSLTGLTVATFHSYCVRVLRRDGDSLAQIRPGFTRTFTIYDEDDQMGIVKAVFRHLGLTEKSFMQYRAALSRISSAKNHKLGPEDMAKDAHEPLITKLAVVFRQYEDRLRQANALDFDDLLLETVRLLNHDDRLREQYNDRIQHVLVDEYQDTNRSQYELMRLISQRRKNICVVGDEDQSIYSWRGADIRNILDFENDFPNAVTVRLEQNYRSTKTILEAASAVVANNKQRKGKWLWTESGAGEKVGLYEAPDGENEALWIADTIERVTRAAPADRVAILYRTNFQSRQIEEALRRYGRKYKVIGGFSFYQRAEIKDMLSFLKASVSPTDDINLLRIINTPARGIGKTTVEQIEAYALGNRLCMLAAIERMLDEKAFASRADSALRGFLHLIEALRSVAESKPVHEVMRSIVEQTGYVRMLQAEDSPDSEARVENVNELVNAATEAAERGETISDFLDHAALVSDADGVDEQAQVSLLTVHNAKGLEFPVVFIAGLEDGLFPHIRSLDSETMMEEERRLCYVAMTRAEKRLFLSWARYRRRFGGGPAEPSIPSRFLREVPSKFVNLVNKPTREVNLDADQMLVRDAVRKNMFTGKTYNSIENISEFFQTRGKQFGPASPAVQSPPQRADLPAGSALLPSLQPPVRAGMPPAPATSPVKPSQRVLPPKRTQPGRVGSTIVHPKYGRGTVMRREGDDENAKLTVSFPAHGLKKLIAKYAGIKTEE
ncbi:MAG TPA: UvrD-helicase domain-containing protein [Bryobacteraceae bacterium]|nr:UvrD-helicase domain-containing protein [Bryobacteraceae bacterium]